ncbi:hypothetical protein DPMN_119453 [Dreissena polymorpha]|uniref:Uncharacterized protein n=1 Tax=Dreissena polymorpha TaxID=45954 RepID=A0A9D4JRZ7_DREPO|nr:hypothetical protein DPMN_119453 [Dreissena polymorpha]
MMPPWGLNEGEFWKCRLVWVGEASRDSTTEMGIREVIMEENFDDGSVPWTRRSAR